MSFLVGDEAVTITYVNLRATPAGESLKVMPPEERLIITGGPVQRAGLIWWQVRDTLSGWVAQETQTRALLIDRYDPSRFGRCLRIVLRLEGGETVDEGGYTLWGISQKAHPNTDVRALTPRVMREIYRKRYWEPIDGDNLGPPLDMTVFDCAVNCGVGAAKQILAVAPKFDAYNQARRYYYRALRNYHKYGPAWLARITLIEIESKK